MRTPLLLAICLLAAPVAATAQGGGIRPLTMTYAARVEFQGETQDGGPRDITVSDTMVGGVRAWLVVHRLTVQGVPGVDSVLMRAGDLGPISRRADLGVRLTLELVDGVMSGELRLPGGTVSLSIPPGERSFLNYHSLRTALREWPLAAGWRGTAGVLQLRGRAEFTALSLEVTGEERIRVPAGEFDCWVVHVTGGVDERWWVSKAGHHLVRSREPFGGRGAILQLDLASLVPAP
jgi:hypothetical protein